MKRYEESMTYGGSGYSDCPCMEEVADGEWCSWDDVQELLKENEDLKGQLQDLLYEIKTLS